MPVLDTSFLIDLETHQGPAMKALEILAAAGEPMLVPAQAAAEYAAGKKDEVAALADIEGSYALVAFGPRHVLEVARLARSAFQRGAFPSWADVQIAAVAVLAATFVVTADPADFAAMGCEVWDYRNGRNPPVGPTAGDA